MSFKAYFIRIKSIYDLDNVDKYLKTKELEGVLYLDYFATVTSKIAQYGLGEFVAAITVDRGDLVESIRYEGKLKWEGLYSSDIGIIMLHEYGCPKEPIPFVPDGENDEDDFKEWLPASFTPFDMAPDDARKLMRDKLG